MLLSHELSLQWPNEHIREPYFMGLKAKLQQSNFVITRRTAAASLLQQVWYTQTHACVFVCMFTHMTSLSSCVGVCVCVCRKLLQRVGQVWKIFKRKVRLEQKKINTLRGLSRTCKRNCRANNFKIKNNSKT